MKEYRFEKLLCEDGIHILAVADNGWMGCWTNEFSPDGEVCINNTSIGEEIAREEAESILKTYGWNICLECGRIYPALFGCVCWDSIESQHEEI